MSNKNRQYCLVEHIWRVIRAIFLLVGTGLWLYTEVSPHFIFASFFLAAVVDQTHGIICNFIERVLNFNQQHSNWD